MIMIIGKLRVYFTLGGNDGYNYAIRIDKS